MSDGSAASAASFTVVNPDGTSKNIYVAPIPISKSKPKRQSKKRSETDKDKEGAKEAKAKVAKAASGRKVLCSSSPQEQNAPATQNSGPETGGSSSTAQSQATPPVAQGDLHNLVRDSLMSLLPEFLRKFKSASQSSAGSQMAGVCSF